MALARRYAVAWQARCKALLRWVKSHGRLPARKADTAREKIFAAWLSACQQKHRSECLTPMQRRSLRAVPGMKARIKEWGKAHAGSSASAGFESRVQALQKWVKAHRGALPKRKAADAGERSLATWLSAQQQRWRALPPDRAAPLLLVPGMRDRAAQWGGSAEPGTPKRRAAAPLVVSILKRPRLCPDAAGDGADGASNSSAETQLFLVGSCVSIWSMGLQKWFDDGQVTKVESDGLVVLFNDRSLEKMVPWSFAPSRVRHMGTTVKKSNLGPSWNDQTTAGDAIRSCRGVAPGSIESSQRLRIANDLWRKDYGIARAIKPRVSFAIS